MDRFQVTHWQLDDYGPWTTTPDPRPEMRLQALQSRLFADLAEAVGERGGYVFRAREDNLVAVTNGLDRAAHAEIRDGVAADYPVTLSAGVGIGETPLAALEAAGATLQDAGSAQDAERASVLRGDVLGETPTLAVAHFDAVDATGRLTDAVDASAALDAMDGVTRALRGHLRERGGLAFFVGGDNVIGLLAPTEAAAYREACEAVAAETGVALRVGVGHGETAREAGMDAKHALEAAREREETVVAPLAAAGESAHAD